MLFFISNTLLAFSLTNELVVANKNQQLVKTENGHVAANFTAGIYLGTSLWGGTLSDLTSQSSKSAFRLDIAYQLNAIHAIGLDFYNSNKGVAESYKIQNNSIDANNWSVQGLSFNYKYKDDLTENSYMIYKGGLEFGSVKTTNSANGNSVSAQYIAPGLGVFYNYIIAVDQNSTLNIYALSLGLHTEYIPEISFQNQKYNASINQLLLGFSVGL